MSGSFSQQLEDLLNPLPRFADPEDDGDEATKAKVSERFDEDGGHEEGGVGLSALRRRNTTLLLETDSRYKGKAVSRKELLMEEFEEEDDEEEEEEEEGSIEEDEEEKSLEDEDEEERKEERSPSRTKGQDLRFPRGVDFHKLTEGMDDLGVSEEDDGSGEDSDGDESIDEDEDEEDDETEDVDGGERVICTFSQEKVDEEVEKGKAVKNQLTLWDQLLEGRIKIQKALMTANQLPQPATLPEFKRRGGVEMAGALKNSHKALKALQRSLLELHDQLLHQSPDTRSILLKDSDGAQSEEDGDEDVSMQETGPAKRKLEMAEYPEVAAKRFAAFRPYCDATLQRWHDKTRLTVGRSSRGFGGFDRNIVTQVEQVLMDKERLLRRTQTRRSEYRVLGKKEAADAAPGDGQEAARQMKANTHLKDLDEDIFDDDDFYHQLLRELIERKTSAADPNDQVAMGRQWLAIQKLRSKIKKKVDTKASKGRKVRFQVHSKLLNFMAPMDHSSMSDEARSELYRGLFGQSAAAAAAPPSRE